MSTTPASTRQELEVPGAAAEVFTMPVTPEDMNPNNASNLTTRQAVSTTSGSTEEMVGAAATVFALPELLELILQLLRASKELFLLRRVNSTFQATIKDSKSLRFPPLVSQERLSALSKVWYPMYPKLSAAALCLTC
ncbi:hypothetical protein LTR15_000083 [Elasticomyces elasticus]|nr:hypothetical protein LTR15_000083 [Elasticomyces elasticus]